MQKDKENNEFDNLIRNRYDKHETHGTADMWKNINEHVQSSDAASYRHRFVFLKWLSIGLLLLLIGTIFYYELKMKNNLSISRLSDIKPTASNQKIKLETSTDNNNASLNKEDSNKVTAKSNIKESTVNKQIIIKNAINHDDNLDQLKDDLLKDDKNNNNGVLDYNDNITFEANNNNDSKTIKKQQGNDIPAPNIINKGDETTTNQDDNNSKNANNDSTKSDDVVKSSLQLVNIIADNQISQFNSNQESIVTDSIKTTIIEEHDSMISDSNLVNLYPQPNVKTPIKLSPFAISASFSPDYTYRQLSNNKGFNTTNSSDYYNQREKGGISFSAELLLIYKFNEKWSLNSGVQFSAYKQTFKDDNVTAFIDTIKNIATIRTSMGNVVLENFELDSEFSNSSQVLLSIISEQHLQVLHIPIEVERQMNAGKVHLFVNMGLMTNIILTNGMKVTFKSTNGSESNKNIEIDEIKGLENLNFGLSVGFGAAFDLNKHFSVLLNPIIKASISSITKNTSVKAYPYSIGISSGMRYNF